MDDCRSGGELVFGPAVGAPDNEPLRRRLRRCFRRSLFGETVRVEAFFDLVSRYAQNPRDAAEEHPRQRFVIFDLQRVILFRGSDERGAPKIGSLVRFLVDGYPLQPFERLAAAERTRPYRFAFEEALLELVPRCLGELAPGEYLVIDLLTGELLPALLHCHPLESGLPRALAAREPAAPHPLQAATVGRNLRSAPPPELDEFVEKHAGIIREEAAGPSSASFALAVTSLSWNRGARQDFCYGRAFSPAEARRVARCEALERFQIAKQAPDARLVRASYLDVSDSAVDPSQLFFGRSPECDQDDGALFDPRVEICWTWAHGVGPRPARLVPAQEIWFNTADLMHEPRMVQTTTSGCAAGATFEEACVFAVLESVERDAFLTSWYLRRPATEIDFATFEGDELNDLVGRFRVAIADYRPVLFDLTSDVGVPTVGGLAIRQTGRGPRVLAAAACHVDPATACFLVLKDLMSVVPDMTPQRLAELRQRPIVPPSPSAHSEFYALDENFSAFDYLQLGRRPSVGVDDIGRDSPIRLASEYRLDLMLESIAARLQSVGAGLYLKDITHPGLADAGLRVARAITPGLYPLWFGGRSRRFAVTERLRRLAKRYTGRSFDRGRLQLAPHPLP